MTLFPRKTVLGSYILMRPIATGGMGSVWEAWLNPYAELGEAMLRGESKHLLRQAGVRSAGGPLGEDDVRRIHDWVQKRTADFLDSPDTEKRFAAEYAQMLDSVAPHRRIAGDFRRAIKVLNEQLGMQPKVVQRFLKEISLQARTLDHPCIVKVVEAGEAAGNYFAVMEYVDAIDLEQSPLPISDAVRVIRLALEGLIHAHQKGFLHRDIKPGNILVSRDLKRVKLTDFGLAKAIDETVAGKLTSTGIIMGTPNYLDPERARGETPTKESDVFSLGTTLYKILTGNPPAHQATTPLETMALIGQDKDFAWPRTMKPQISELLEDVLMMMLSKDIRMRLTTHEVRALLGRLEKENLLLHQEPTEDQERSTAAQTRALRRKISKLKRRASRPGRPDSLAATAELYEACAELAELQPRSGAAGISARIDALDEALAFHQETFAAPGMTVPETLAAQVQLLEKRRGLERRRLENAGLDYTARPPRRAGRRMVRVLLLAVLAVGAYYGYLRVKPLWNESVYEEARQGASQVQRHIAGREHAKAAKEIEKVQIALDRLVGPHAPEFERRVKELHDRIDADRRTIGRYQADIQVYTGLMDAFRLSGEEYDQMKAGLASGKPPSRKAVVALEEHASRLLARLRDPKIVNPEAIGPEITQSVEKAEELIRLLVELRAQARDE